MKQPSIAVFTKNRTNAAYAGARLGAERVAERMGGRAVHYVPETPDSAPEQIALIEHAIGERPDAMVLVPADPDALTASIAKINAAGIPIVNLISEMGFGERVCFVGSDDCALAEQIARYTAARLAPGARVLVLEGIPTSSTNAPRLRGIALGLAATPGLVTVASLRGDYQRDIACNVVLGQLRQGLRLEAIVAANDSMALGALDALDAAQYPAPRPLVVGINAIPEAITAIKAGRLFATADFDAMKLACIATEAAIRHLRGEVVPARIMLPVQVVDRANCSHWNLPYESRDCPSWADVVEGGQ